MGHKKKHEEHVNHERWLVSYADFITLLFATFTALFAISNADKEKFSKMAKSLKNAFATDIPTDVSRIGLKGRGLKEHRNPGALDIFRDKNRPNSAGPVNLTNNSGEQDKHSEVDGSTSPPPDSGLGTKRSESDPEKSAEEGVEGLGKFAGDGGGKEGGKVENGTGRKGGSAWAEETETQMTEMIEQNNLGVGTSVRQDKRGLVISLSEDAYFEAEATDVRPESLHKLDKILGVLKNGGYTNLAIEAHADSAPLRSAIYRSASDLTTQRALRIFEYMVQKFNFNPEDLSPSGYGPYRPIDTNDTEYGRRRNRRVDIVILNPERIVSSR